MKSKKAFRVHLFKVVTAEGSEHLDDVLSLINSSSLKERIRDLGYKLRLEAIQSPVAAAPYWLLDFSKLRYDGGPGRASATTPTESFDLDDGEGFSEETAVLYCPATGYAAIQYNHHGPRVGVIADYLGVYKPEPKSTYDFRLKLKDDAQARLAKKTIFTHLEMKVAPARLTNAFKRNNVSLSSMLKRQADEFGGDVVTITVGLEQRSNLSLKLRSLLPTFFRMADEEMDAVSALKISGKDSAEAPVDPVDLIADKEKMDFHGLQMDSGLRYLRTERWNALERAYLDWKRRGLMV